MTGDKTKAAARSRRSAEARALEAGEYALGTLDAEARVRFAAQLKDDPALNETLAAWERRLEKLAPLGEAAAPPAGLWPRVEAAIDRLEAARPGTLTIPAGEGDWQEILPGVAKKTLFVDRAAGCESYLLKMAPGARLPAHEHAAAEECLMLEGEAFIGDLRLVAGDYHVVSAGTPHAEVTSERGSLAYIRGEIRTAA